MKQKKEGKTVHFASLMDFCHLKNSQLEPKFQEYRGSVVLLGDILKDDSGSYAVFTEQGSSASQMTSAKVMDIVKISRMRRTSCRRSIRLHPSQHGRCNGVTENSQFGVSRHLDLSTTTQMAKIMVQYGRSSCSSWAEFVRSPFGRTVMGQAIWENLIETWMGENSKLVMSLCSSWKRIILICVCGWHKIGWKETKSWSDVESTQQRSRFGRTNIIPWSCISGVHSKTMPNKQRYCGQL